MSTAQNARKRGNPFNSLFFKCTLMVAVCVVAVVATITVNERRSKIALTEAAVSNRAAEVTGLLSMQLGGAIKFGNTAAVDAIVSDVIEAARPDATGAYVVALNGTELFNAFDAAADAQGAAELAQTALQTAKSARSADGLMVAFPAYFGDAKDVAGVVVTQWTKANQLAALAKLQNQNLMLGGGVLVVALFLSGVFLRTQMSRPLIRIEETMGHVAGGEYDCDVPFTRRGDEVGNMARRLDTFRLALAEARDAARESAFKSAAFGGSGAAMMMTDENMNVIFYNPRCKGFLEMIGSGLQAFWPGLDPNNPLGASLDDFSTVSSHIKEIREHGETAFPISTKTKFGDFLVEISMNAALDEKGEMIGAVIQWSDRTEASLNAAVLSAIDKNQLRIEFAASGSVIASNENIDKALGLPAGRKSSPGFQELFQGKIGEDITAQDIKDAIMAGVAMFGQFEMKNYQTSEKVIVEGSFATTIDPEGRIERAIFLGTDVTEAALAIQSAEAERLRISKEQEKVVDTLGVSLKKLSEGNLNSDIVDAFPADYERLRVDFNAAVGALREAISAVVHNADSIRNEAKEITSAADDLSRRTEKQAATLEETAAALDELTSSVRSAAEGADQASKISTDAQSNAEQGGEVAKMAVKAMDAIKVSSQEISKITTVIDDIAFQTNLLALNAGVEAARAGEAGRGFAVVATEVRALAQRSSDAAREINTLISSSGEQVVQGVELVDKTGESLSAIVMSISEISQRVASIAASAREQSAGLNEINSAVSDLDHVTQQNAAMFEETTAASHALTTEADALASAVASFDLGDHGKKKHAVLNAPERARASKPVPRPGTSANLALSVEEEESKRIDPGWEEF